MKLKLIQYYTPNCTYATTSEKINKLYCEKHNIEYFSLTDRDTIVNNNNGRAIQWYKIKYIQDQIRNSGADYIIYVDADAVVVKPEKDIRDIINAHSDKELIISSDFGPDIINTGVMIFKCTPWALDFLERIWNAGDYISRGKYRMEIWHEQTIMSAFLFINPDDRSKTTILNPSDMDSINDHILRDGLTFIYHDLSKIRIAEIHKLCLGDSDVMTKLNLSCTSDRHVSHHYCDYYVQKINEVLAKKNEVNILDVGGDKGVVFNLMINHYKNLNYTNIVAGDYETANPKIEKIVVDDVTEQSLDEFLKNNNREYDLVIADHRHQCKYRDLIFSKLFDKVSSGGVFIVEDLQTDREIAVPDKNAQYGWGDPSKKSMTQLINEFKNSGTFISDYYDFKDLNTKIEKAEIHTTVTGALLGLIYKK